MCPVSAENEVKRSRVACVNCSTLTVLCVRSELSGGAIGDGHIPQPEAAARAKGPSGEGFVLRLVTRQASHCVFIAGEKGAENARYIKY